MKPSVAVLFSLLLASAVLLEAADKDKIPMVESGYITKVDLKKKILTIRGSVRSIPEGVPVQSSGGRGRGRGSGPGATPRGSGNAGGRGGAEADSAREFKIYVSGSTVIQGDKVKLGLDELNVQDYVMIVGIPKGKSLNLDASSIAVSDR